MKIFGIGFMKTGVSSLGAAFHILGFKPLWESNKGWTFSYKILQREIYNKNLFNSSDIKEFLDIIYKYNGFTDAPWYWPDSFEKGKPVYQWVYENVPNSKFILTTRKNSQTWYESLGRQLRADTSWETADLSTADNNVVALISLKQLYLFGIKKYFDYINLKKELKTYYENYNNKCREFFSDKDEIFLEVCFEKGDKWKKICNFLEMDIPPNNFPHLNKRSR